MKGKYFLITAILLVLNSCTIEKRLYNKGFHVERQSYKRLKYFKPNLENYFIGDKTENYKIDFDINLPDSSDNISFMSNCCKLNIDSCVFETLLHNDNKNSLRKENVDSNRFLMRMFFPMQNSRELNEELINEKGSQIITPILNDNYDKRTSNFEHSNSIGLFKLLLLIFVYLIIFGLPIAVFGGLLIALSIYLFGIFPYVFALILSLMATAMVAFYLRAVYVNAR